MAIRKCINCGKMKKHYARGLCPSCYARASRHQYDIDELRKWDEAKSKRNKMALKKKKKLDSLRNETMYDRMPRAEAAVKFYNWYYKTNNDRMTINFKNKEERRRAYDTLYAFTKRRNNIPVKITMKDLTMTVERIAP